MEIMATVAVTLEDYFADLQSFLRDVAFLLAAKESLHFVWVTYVTKLLQTKSWAKEGFSEVIDEDIEVLQECFNEYIEPAVVQQYCDRLYELKGLFEAKDSNEAFENFSVLFRHGFTTAMLKKSIQNIDISSSEASSLMSEATE